MRANNLRKNMWHICIPFCFRASESVATAVYRTRGRTMYLRMFKRFSIANSVTLCTQRFKRNPEASFTTCCQFSSSWCRPHSLNPVRISGNMQSCYGPQGTWEKKTIFNHHCCQCTMISFIMAQCLDRGFALYSTCTMLPKKTRPKQVADFRRIYIANIGLF